MTYLAPAPPPPKPPEPPKPPDELEELTAVGKCLKISIENKKPSLFLRFSSLFLPIWCNGNAFWSMRISSFLQALYFLLHTYIFRRKLTISTGKTFVAFRISRPAY